MASCSISRLSQRGVRSLAARNFRAPWFFVKKGAKGQRKLGIVHFEKWKWPGQHREFDQISPKFQKLNLPATRGYTQVQPTGIVDPASGQFKEIPEMIPELIVPNLEGFKLLPYVSYRTDAMIEKRERMYSKMVREKGSEELADLYTSPDERWPPPAITAETLFDLYYAPIVREAFKRGEYDDSALDDASQSSSTQNEDKKQ